MSDNDNAGCGKVIAYSVLALLAIGFFAYITGNDRLLGATDKIGGTLSIVFIIFGLVMWFIMWITGNTKEK